MSGLGLGIIGCGVISEIYLKNARLFPQLDLRAVADLNADAAGAKAAAHGTTALTPEALLARDDIDIVLNLTVPAAHLSVGLAALQAGKHVFSEKPLAVSLDDGKRLAEAADKRGLRIGCAPDTFLGASHQTSRAVLDAGRIGQPVAGTAMMMVAGHERWHPNPDFYYAGPGAGPLYDMGPYYITAMVNLLGPVRAVSGMASRLRASRTIASGPRAGESIPVDARTHVAGVMEFANGALIQIATSFDVPAHGHTPLELYGTTASMKIPDPNRFDGQVMLSGPDGWQAVPSDHDFGGDNHRALGLADMADAILTGRAHRAGGDLALHVLDVIASLLQAADTGRTVTLTSTCARPEPMHAGALTHLTATEAA